MVWVQVAIGTALTLGVYAWLSLGLQAIFTKLEGHGGAAWVPIYRYARAAALADVPTAPVWIARSIAAVAWSVLGVAVVVRAADVVAGSSALAAVAMASSAVAIVATIVGWVLWIVGASRIEFLLVVRQRLWWLAALMPPLWACVVGFGSAHQQPTGPVSGEAAAASDETRAIPRVEPPPPLADNPTEDLPDEHDQPPSADPAELREDPMQIEENDHTGEIPRAYSPYDVPSLTPVPLPDPPSPWGLDDDDDATFFAKRRRARWVLRVVGAEEYDLEDITTIGREGLRPIPGVLPIIDDTRTMSKLHARLRREGDRWFVTDLGSTNGTFIRDRSGSELEVKAQSEAEVVGPLLLGDLEALIVDQREVSA